MDLGSEAHVYTNCFLLLEEKLLSSKENSGASRCDSPCQRSLVFITVWTEMLDFRQL